jgi:hypothetical protein
MGARISALAFLALLPPLPAALPQDSSGEFETRVRPLLASHCFGCHGPKKREAKLDLSTVRTEAELARDPRIWLQVVKQVRGRFMPPEDAPKPLPEADRERIWSWLEGAVARIDDRAPRDPGRVTLRRLNRAEYTNTIRDLVGLELSPADDFPADDVSEGFDTLGDVLSLPPMLLEKYLDAADRVLDRAIVTDGPVVLLEKRVEAESLAREGARDGVVEMPFEREFTVALSVPASGRYEIRARGRQERSPDGAAVIAVKVDGVESALVSVREEGTASAAFELAAGERRLGIRHTPPRAFQKNETVPDTRLFLDWIEIAGPERAASHRRIFFVEPGAGEAAERDAARRIVERFAARAFRRPVSSDEVGRLVALYDAGRRKGKGFAAAVRLGLWSILVSPHFLFRVERDTADRDESGHVRLGDWEIASRLSYFLWSTMPDGPLLELAARGKLRDPAVLRSEVRRMLADGRARALVENFGLQWLGLRRFDQVHPDREMYPVFTEPLRQAMVEEVRLFLANLVREDRPILDLVDADYTFLNERLARHYGIAGVKGDPMRRVPIADRNRGGVITMAAVLTLTSHPTRTSAVKRGKWILDEILGAPPPPPPPNVPELEQASRNRPDAASLTLRQRLELHRADPACTNCHKRMDVLGLGLENFDPVGRWREKDAGKRIEAGGTLPTGESFAGVAELKKVLAASRDEFARAAAEKMFVFALGRPLEGGDRREVRRAVEELRRGEYRFSALVEAVATSYPFRHRRAAGKEEAR